MRFVTLSYRCSYSLVVACSLTVSTATIVAAGVEPYEARVVVARAQVRSGPGENFYPTDALVQGETVEVHREQADGWLAIRPPQDSFSWVFGRHLKLQDGGLAEIDKEAVASRIGSRFGSQRNAVQVQLRKGEVVEILGEEESGGETWYKIAPPAGEFRWIHASNVKRVGRLENADAKPDPNHEPTVVAASTTNEAPVAIAENVKQNTAEPAVAPHVSKTPAGPDWRAAASRERTSSADFLAPPLATAASLPPPAESPAAAVPPTVAAPAPVPSANQPPDTLARKLTDIELRLSRMVAAPPSQWNTERLECDTEDLLAEAQTAEEREVLKSMLSKLDRFEAIARQHQGQGAGSGAQGVSPVVAGLQPVVAGSQPVVAGSPDPATPLTEGLAGSTGSGDPRTTGQTPTDTRHPTPDTSKYDAVGILRPVVSKWPGAPQFALVNERGQVISFVTPTPDVNLQPYLGHRVGVTGTRGFIPEFQRAHVTAGRVTPLSERLVR